MRIRFPVVVLILAISSLWVHAHTAQAKRVSSSPPAVSGAAQNRASAALAAASGLPSGAGRSLTPASAPLSPADLQAQAEQILDGAQGTAAMVALRPGQPPMVSINAGEQLPSASLYKLGVMAAVYRAIADGRVELDQQITVTQEDVDLYGAAPATDPGTTLSVQEALKRMITVSDNSAAGALVDLVGPADVNAAFTANGMPHSYLGVGPGEPNTPAQTTAGDQAAFFERLLGGQVVSRGASDAMLALLKEQQENDRLPARLPAGTTVAHKTGELDGTRNDAGVIFTPSGPVICAVLISDQGEAQLEIDAIANEGLLLYQQLAGA